jgi:sialic acid synthase SpsE
VYFIADIGANHDGNLERAKLLIRLAAESGADAAKFQHFRAAEIASRQGFAALGGQLAHQATWKKPAYQVYQDASLPREWTAALKEQCDAAGIDFLSTPYDLEAIDLLDRHVPAFKVGSGDITWNEILVKVGSKGKPVILSTGASDIGDVQRAVHVLQEFHVPLVLMQCNTNYSGKIDNFQHIHLNVLKTYQCMFPETIAGLSDHTPGHSTVLGAIALGARVVEKHFTDDPRREGPDHPFSMTPRAWREMVDRSHELQLALGSSDKRVAANEAETVVVQRRSLRATRELQAGSTIDRESLAALRPAPSESIAPYELNRIIGMRLREDVAEGEYLRWTMLEPRG